MRYTNPDSLEYDEQLFQKLDSFDKDELRRFFNLYYDQTVEREFASDAAISKDGLRKILAADFQSETETLLARYQQLRDEAVRIGDATQYLAEETDLSGKELEVGSLAELLILLYEREYKDQLNKLIAGIDLRRHQLNRSYYLDATFEPRVLSSNVERFIDKWYSSQATPVPVRIEVESQSGQSGVLHLYREKRSSAKTYPVFAFRQSEDKTDDEIPRNPEVKQIQIQTLDELRMRLQVAEGGTVITLNNSRSGWTNILNQLFEITHGVKNGASKLERYRSTEAEEIEDDLEDSMDKQLSPDDTPLDTAREILRDRRSKALAKVDNLDLPPKKREELKDCIQTVSIGGSDIQDDQSIATQEFRLVGDLPQLFSSVDIEDGYRDLLNKSNPDSRGLVIQVNGKGLRLKDGRWKKLDAGGLATIERQAIEQVFEETQS